MILCQLNICNPFLLVGNCNTGAPSLEVCPGRKHLIFSFLFGCMSSACLSGAHLMAMLRGCVTLLSSSQVSVEQVVGQQSAAEEPSSGVGWRQNGSRQGRHVEAWKGGRGKPHPALDHLLRPEKPLAITFIGKISKGGRTKNRWRGFLGSLDTESPLEGREGCPPRNVEHFPHG